MEPQRRSAETLTHSPEITARLNLRMLFNSKMRSNHLMGLIFFLMLNRRSFKTQSSQIRVPLGINLER
jgi:hypothetical protein